MTFLRTQAGSKKKQRESGPKGGPKGGFRNRDNLKGTGKGNQKGRGKGPGNNKRFNNWGKYGQDDRYNKSKQNSTDIQFTL